MAPITIVLNFAPSREAQAKAQRRLTLHIRAVRDGWAGDKRIVRLQGDDMIDLTGGEQGVR
jgi:hypothetical protein